MEHLLLLMISDYVIRDDYRVNIAVDKVIIYDECIVNVGAVHRAILATADRKGRRKLRQRPGSSPLRHGFRQSAGVHPCWSSAGGGNNADQGHRTRDAASVVPSVQFGLVAGIRAGLRMRRQILKTILLALPMVLTYKARRFPAFRERLKQRN